DQQASPALVGVLGALFSAVATFVSVPAGRWADRIGARLPMMASGAAFAGSCLLGFVAPGLAMMFVVAVIAGTANIVFYVANQDAVGRYGRPEDRVGNFSQFSLVFAIGSFIAPLIAGYAAENIGYRGSFLLFCLIALAVPAFLYFTKQQLPT